MSQTHNRPIADQVDLPPGYLVTWGGQFRLQQEANKRSGHCRTHYPLRALPAAVFQLQFAQKRDPDLAQYPLALVGGVVALWLTGQNLSVPSSVGFIALFGIALENSMVLVTYFNQLVRDGVDLDEASIQGACLRVRPVLDDCLPDDRSWTDSAVVFQRHRQREVQRPLATVVVARSSQFHRVDLAGTCRRSTSGLPCNRIAEKQNS